ncbi:putative kinase phosphatase [Aeromonas phage Ahp1]|uniref:Putative kinase phosphatase n=1 Tax=Aeromonas phage Ahp1 TaxID=1747286 RepID=A0A1S5Q8E0_9CAUD|nr:polynucleotide kinase [Aeromonas phage Ahp1]ALP47745.1 putative kinase phosphatase [Aeromonas phage Ahp1]
MNRYDGFVPVTVGCGRRIAIWDLDGTLSCGLHRLHLLPAKDKANRCEAWDEFNMAAINDAPILHNIELYKTMRRDGWTCIILTGRGGIARAITVAWLLKHGILLERPDRELIMRAADDHRVDTVFKEEVVKMIRHRMNHEVIMAFDDAEHIVKHFRQMGVPCLQVTHYDNPSLDKQAGNGEEA